MNKQGDMPFPEAPIQTIYRGHAMSVTKWYAVDIGVQKELNNR